MPDVPEIPNEETPIPAPRGSQEEVLIQSAAQGIDEVDDQPQRSPVVMAPQKRSFKKPVIILLVALIVGVGGFFAWSALSSNKTDDTIKKQPASSQDAPRETLSYAPQNVIYAFRANNNDPYAIYYRPAGGGDRMEAMKLVSRDDGVTYADVRGSRIAFASTDAIYTSQDSGKTYKKITSLKAGEQVTSLKLSTDGTSIAYGLLPDVGSKNTVKTVSVDGKAEDDLFTSDKPGVFIYAWNKSLKQIFYQEGCYNCDGSVPGDMLRDLTTNKVTNPLTKSAESILTGQPVISDDFSTIVYQLGKTTAAGRTLDLGILGFPPYTINVFTVADSKTAAVATIGAAGQTNTNGTPKDWRVSVGFQAGTSNAYYTVDDELFSVNNGAGESIYKAPKIINDTYYLNFVQKSFIYDLYEDNGIDFTLNNYGLKTLTNTKIFEGDSNTRVLGVTTR